MILVVPIVFLFISFRFDLLGRATSLSSNLHEICLMQMPSSPVYKLSTALTPALLCAEPIQSESLKQLFIRSSLFHLVVVSGAHLTVLIVLFTVVLKLTMGKINANKNSENLKIFLIGVFITYALMCLLQAPIVRSVLALILQILSRRLKLALGRLTILTLSVLFCLVLHPPWLQSLSLLLSSICSLVLIVATEIKIKSHRENYLIYFAIMPFLWGWGSLHPVGILTNIFIAPLVGILWIPLAIATCLISQLLPFYEEFLSLLIRSLTLILDVVPNTETSPSIPIFILWILFWSLTLFVNFKIIKSKQCA